MGTENLDASLRQELKLLADEGRAKPEERVIRDYLPAEGENGPRYLIEGSETRFLRFNSNSYLSLSNHPDVMAAADAATAQFGTGPGAVRFIDGTFTLHTALEKSIAGFMRKPAAKIFNSAYTANCGLALAISNKKTFWIGDALNHNSIIRAMRISNIPSDRKAIFKHNDLQDLERCLDLVPDDIDRVIVIFDGVFSMRGDVAPVKKIQEACNAAESRFPDGVITVMDDSHGIGAFGETGRGTMEHQEQSPDIIVGTFGKAFGVNGGFIAASPAVIEAVRQKADTYIYTNPLSVADCAAALKAIEICDSEEGRKRLKHLREGSQMLRKGFSDLGLESIPGPHPITPLVVRDTGKTHHLVRSLFENGILSVGLTFPVVPRGDETIRFQVNACHSGKDIEYVIEILEKFK